MTAPCTTFCSWWPWKKTEQAPEDREKKKKKEIRDYVATFFNHTQTSHPFLPFYYKNRPEEQKSSYIKNALKTYKIAQIIARRDLEALKKETPEDLSNLEVIEVKPPLLRKLFSTVHSRFLGGENALALVLIYSAMDETPEDRDKTIAMLKILFEKNLNPYIHIVYGENAYEWTNAIDVIKNGMKIVDFVGMPTLSQFASLHSFPEAKELIDEYIKNYGPAPADFFDYFSKPIPKETNTATL